MRSLRSRCDLLCEDLLQSEELQGYFSNRNLMNYKFSKFYLITFYNFTFVIYTNITLFRLFKCFTNIEYNEQCVCFIIINKSYHYRYLI